MQLFASSPGPLHPWSHKHKHTCRDEWSLYRGHFPFVVQQFSVSDKWTSEIPTVKVRDAQWTQRVNIAWVFQDPLLVLFKWNTIYSSVRPLHERSSCMCTKIAFWFLLTALSCVVIVLQLVAMSVRCCGCETNPSPGPKLEVKPTLNDYSCCHRILYAQIQFLGCDLTLCLAWPLLVPKSCMYYKIKREWRYWTAKDRDTTVQHFSRPVWQ